MLAEHKVNQSCIYCEENKMKFEHDVKQSICYKSILCESGPIPQIFKDQGLEIPCVHIEYCAQKNVQRGLSSVKSAKEEVTKENRFLMVWG